MKHLDLTIQNCRCVSESSHQTAPAWPNNVQMNEHEPSGPSEVTAELSIRVEKTNKPITVREIVQGRSGFIQWSLDLILIQSIRKVGDRRGFARANGAYRLQPQRFLFLPGKCSRPSRRTSSSLGGWSSWSRASSAEVGNDGRKMREVKEPFWETHDIRSAGFK